MKDIQTLTLQTAEQFKRDLMKQRRRIGATEIQIADRILDAVRVYPEYRGARETADAAGKTGVPLKECIA